jgi:hypothetical protein
MYQRAIAGYKKVLGVDHRAILGIVNNLAVLYNSKANYQAEQMYQREIAGREKKKTATVSFQ